MQSKSLEKFHENLKSECTSCKLTLDRNMWVFQCGHAFQRCCIFKFMEQGYASCPECIDPKSITNRLYFPKSCFRRRTMIHPT